MNKYAIMIMFGGVLIGMPLAVSHATTQNIGAIGSSPNAGGACGLIDINGNYASGTIIVDTPTLLKCKATGPHGTAKKVWNTHNTNGGQCYGDVANAYTTHWKDVAFKGGKITLTCHFP